MIAFDCRLARPEFHFDVTFEAGPGITALFGPSGAGKSTAIRLLAGLDRPDSGRIAIDGTPLADTAARVFVPPHRRGVGLVFQDALLFPHLSVQANLTYGRWFNWRAGRRVGRDAVVEVLGIGHLLTRRPDTLSGGERQRVAIGRALLAGPRLLLLDEPLASLDSARKLEILPFIERMRDEFAIPIVYVSHSVEEVVRLADHVVRLEAGHVVAAGTPMDVLAPATLLQTAGRFEAISILSASVKQHLQHYGLSVLAHPAGDVVVAGQLPEGRHVRVVVRATDVTLSVGAPGEVSVRTVLSGQIEAIETGDGPFALVTVDLAGGDTLKSYATRLAVDRLGLTVGKRVRALVKAVAIDERGVTGGRQNKAPPDG